jgi:hypothetical protein
MQEGRDPRHDGGDAVWSELEALRAASARVAAAQADQLTVAARFAARVRAEARLELASGARVSGRPDDEVVIDSAVIGEVTAALGTSQYDAGRLVDLADRLVGVLPETRTALEHGRIDLPRAQALAQATAVLSDDDARRVEAQLLPGPGAAPWDGSSPRAWKERVLRVVHRVDRDAVRRRRERAMADRCVRAWPNGDGTADLLIRGEHTDVVMAEQVLSDLAARAPETGPDGQPRSVAQRRADVFFDTLRRIRDGQPLPALAIRREREIGLVLHADTLFSDGPAAQDPGELRGLGSPEPVEAASAAQLAREQIAGGAGTRVLLTDAYGTVRHLVRLSSAPPGGWTRESLVQAVRGTLPTLPPLWVEGYSPTGHIADHVRARSPRCTAYACPRAARRCDLDHDEPWPRGPTAVHNLHPRCRRHHELKTRRLLRTRLAPDGTLATTMLTGVTTVTRPPPLPGHGAGEGYAHARGERSAHGTGEVDAH